MVSKIEDSITLEYIQRGIVSSRQIKDIQVLHRLSNCHVEDPVSTLVAHGVCMLDNEKAEHLKASKQVFSIKVGIDTIPFSSGNPSAFRKQFMSIWTEAISWV